MEALKLLKAARWIPAFAGMTVLLFSYSAHAQDETKTEEPAVQEEEAAAEPEETAEPAEAQSSATYSPSDCEFTVTFPEDPYVTQRCEDAGKKRCFQQVSFTKVYDMASTVNFRVTCNPADESMYEQYSGDVMQAALKALTQRSTVDTYNTSFREDTHYKQAGLVGQGKVGLSPTLYIGQLWIGHKSVLTVEAEMIGEAHDRADELFTQVLKSVGFVEGKEIVAPAEEEEEKTDEAE